MTHSNKVRRLLYILLLTAFSSFILIPVAYAVSFSPTVSLSSNTADTAADMTLTFTPTSNISAGGYFVWEIPGTDTREWNVDNMDFEVDGSDRTLQAGAALPSGYNAFGHTSYVDGLVYIYLDENGPGITSGSTVVVKIGSNATYGTQGSTIFTNGSAGTATYSMQAYDYYYEGGNHWQKMTTDGENDYEATITATAAPEFNTYILISVLIVGTWVAYKHKLSPLRTRARK